MAKLPKLIIPVTIDSSGVDRGINNVNSRLRRGSGRFGVGGGGFGGGGAAAGGGGGSVGEMVLGSAIGSSIGGSSFATATGFAAKRNQRFINRTLEYQTIAKRHLANLQDLKSRGFGKLYPNLDIDIMDAQMGVEDATKTFDALRENTSRKRAVGRGMRQARMNRLMDTAKGIITSKAGMLGIGAGAIFGAMKIGDMNRTLQGTFGDISKFEESPDYAAAREFRDAMLANKKSTATRFERFMLAAGPNSNVTKGLMTASELSGNLFEDLGYLASGQLSKIGTQRNIEVDAINQIRQMNNNPQTYKNTIRGSI